MAFVLHNRRISRQHRLDKQFEFIFEDTVKERALDRTVFIVPTGRRGRLLQRTAVQSSARIGDAQTGSVVQGHMRIHTLESFISECARNIFGNALLRLSDAYVAALMEEAASKADLQFFSRPEQELGPATLERLTNVVLGLKEDGVTPESLRLDIRNARLGDEDITDIKRLSDIERLFAAYEALLGDHLADRSRLLIYSNEYLRGERDKDGRRIASKQVETPSTPDVLKSAERLKTTERWDEILKGVDAIYIDGFSEFKPPEIDFLALLSAAQPHVRIFLDYSERNGPLFGNLQSTFELLRTVGYDDYTEDQNERNLFYEPEEHTPPDSYLRRWLFNTELDIRNTGLDEVTQVWGAASRIEEVRLIAREIKHLTLKADEGIAAAEICIVMRRPEFYADLFREVFAEYDIPSNVTDRFSMASSPVAVAIFAVIDLALQGFRREDVGRALQNPYISFAGGRQGKERKGGLDGTNLLKVAQRLRIAGGHRNGGASAWVRRIESRLEVLRRRLEQSVHDAARDEDELRELRREQRECERALDDFSVLRNAVPPADEHLTPFEFAASVKRRIIRDLGIRESIIRFQAAAGNIEQNNQVRRAQTVAEVEKDARAYTAMLELIDELAYIQQERGGGPELTATKAFRFYADRLRTAARARRYQVREQIGFGVTITSLEQIRNIPFRVTFICGLVDGEFPAVYVPESFLGKDLPQTEDRFMRSERMQFYQALTNAPKLIAAGDKRLYLTYPRFRGADELVRSPFVDALLKITNLEAVGRVIELDVDDASTGDAARHVLGLRQAIAGSEELLAAMGRISVQADTTGKDEAMEHLAAAAEDLNRAAEARRVRRGARQPILTSRVDLQKNKLTAPAADVFNARVHKPTSISALEQYAQCPYQYFADRVLRLEVQEEFDNALSPLERGALLHRILFHFYREQQVDQLADGHTFALPAADPALPVLAPVFLDRNKQAHYQQRLRAIGEREFEHLRFEHPLFDVEREEILGGDKQRGLLDIWLQEELKRSETPEWNYAPALFEWAFGRDDTDKQGGVIPAADLGDGLKLTGKIDRVDADIRGLDGGAPLDAAIIDYKSGQASKQPGNSRIKRGLSLQMPLYSLVLEKVLHENYNIDGAVRAALYLALTPDPRPAAGRDIDARTLKAVLTDKETGKALGLSTRSLLPDTTDAIDLRTEALNFARGYIANIAGGAFNITPVETAICTFCDYAPLCRIRELRGNFQAEG